MRHIRDARVLSGWGIPGVALAFKERWAAWKKSGLVPECYQISCGVCSGGDAVCIRHDWAFVRITSRKDTLA